MRSGLLYSLADVIAFGKCWCKYLELTMKNGCRMTFLPDLISSGLMAVLTFSQPTVRMTSGQETTIQSAAVIGPGHFSSFQ